MAASAISPIGATPFAGVVPWLASLWRRLRKSVEEKAASDEELQVLHLIEFAVSRFGDPLLRAASLDDLDDKLDELIASREALHCAALLAEHVGLFQKSEAASAAGFAAVVGQNLGAAQGRVLSDAQQILDAWLDAQRQATCLISNEEPVTADRIAEFSLSNPDIPAELAELLFHSSRAGFCSLAIAHALVQGTHVEPWLAHALTERLVASARQHLRLLASLPEITVDENIIPRAERLDVDAIAARHQRARTAAQRSFHEARTRLGL